MQKRLQFENIFWISLLHIGAVCALFYFSWGALVVCLVLLFGISSIGINLTYHRLLCHRGFKVPRWFEYVLSTIAATSGQGPMLLWIAEHRLHHRFSDTDDDPHNARKGAFYAHMGHLFYHKEFEDEPNRWKKYVPDLNGISYYHFLSKYSSIFVAIPAVALFYWGGISYFLWGVCMRIVLMWHITWSVNSATHLWGYQTYQTSDNSRNLWWVALLAAGEGWHNNHHACAVSAAHGREWWEFDQTYLMIRFLKWIGLATQVKVPAIDKRMKIALPSEAEWMTGATV